MSAFKDLKLSDWIQKQLEVLGVTQPSPIQAKCIPEILQGKDVIGVAQTGSGKTFAFALPILQNLSEDPYGIFALVLTPTRELAYQIADQFRVVGKRINLRDCVVVGGVDIISQAQALSAKPHVVIATPGRLADHLKHNDTFSLKKIRYLVLDEADRMMDGSFDEHLQLIFKALPTKRQTLLFTATVNDSLETLMKTSMKTPFVFEAESKQVTVEKLDQKFVMTSNEARDGYLVHVLQQFTNTSDKGLVIIFVETKRECEVFSQTLMELGFPNVSLHGDKSTRERQIALSAFRSHQARLLVATNVASRGLDVPAVDFVINHNVPKIAKDYVHRVGRTARAGRGGSSVTLVTPNDVEHVKAIEELIKTELEEMAVKDEDVAEILTQVKVAKREQEIKLASSDLEEKKEIYRRKKLLDQGLDPDEEDRKREAERAAKRKQLRREKKKEQKEAKRKKLDLPGT